MSIDNNDINRNDIQWEENLVQFKDPVYGYIGVPKVYSCNLIDTIYLQRLKGVAQSGIRPLFSAATHDRFSHSLGVYKFANMAYASLRTSMQLALRNKANLGKLEYDKLSKELASWENLLSIAAIIHDIGHPSGSHSFEFLYDDIFMQLYSDDNKIIDVTNYDGWKEQLERVERIFADYRVDSSGREHSYSNSKLMKELKEKILGSRSNDELKGSAHERMSVYLLLNDAALNTIVRNIILANWNYINRVSSTQDEDLDDAMLFICRIIIGQEYPCTYTTEFYPKNYENSMRNCVIHLINGVLDADSMDYIMRNSYSAGYATHKVDYDRLCAAFSTIENQNILESCFSKSSLSVIEGFIVARNFEPKWLYSHHKVVYYDVLVKSIYHYSAKYLCYMDYLFHKDRFDSEYKSAQDNGINNEITPAGEYVNGLLTGRPTSLVTNTTFPLLSLWPYSYYTYILAPYVKFYSQHFCSHSAVDADLDSMFKSIHLKLTNEDMQFGDNKIFNDLDKEVFILLLNEYQQRKLKRSLWKSHAEYLLLIKEVGAWLGLPDATIHKYMLELIQYGLEPWNFGIQKYVKDITDVDLLQSFPASYEEQYIYRPYSFKEALVDTDSLDIPTYFARVNAGNVFGAFDGRYDFSYKYCSCKIYKAKFKDFGKLKIKFGNKAYRIGDVIDIPREKPLEFPYIFYTSNADANLNVDPENVRWNFTQNFKAYCAGRFSCEQSKKGGRSMDKSFDGQHVIRDVVHGDITFTDQYLDVINAKEFQRLRRIKQLATASQVFPNATHTRFAHSIGTYHIMKMIIAHFQQIFSDLHINDIGMDDAPIALLAALLHDIGHGPFSHAFEAVAKDAVRHEVWTERIILDEKSEIHQRIVKNFGEDTPQKVVNCINHVFQDDKKHLNFSMIYSGLVSGSLDADRMDYLLRDAYNTAALYGSIDVQNIIASMRIAQIDGTYCVCFDENYLSYIEQLIFTRYEMYDNIYFENYKVLTETLVQCILQRAYQKRNLLQNDARLFLETVFDANMKIADFLELDDHTMSHYFQQWRNEREDGVLAEMCRSLIDRTGYRSVHVSDNSDSIFLQLLESTEKICGFLNGELTTIAIPRKMFGLIRETRYTNAYPDERVPNDISKSIFIMKKNGLVSDFRNETRLHSKSDKHFWRVHKSYLFYNPIVMSLELEARSIIENMPNQQTKDIETQIKNIEKNMGNFVPRNHIEIEEKYRCDEETLQAIETFLIQPYPDSTSFMLQSQFRATLQEDIYFDTAERLLDAKKCSLRIRKINNAYTCTVKLPVHSENFGGNSQFARFEYEATLPSPELSGFADFINTYLRLKGIPLINETITSSNINSLFIPTITIINNRKKAVVVRNKDNDNFECEVCLDDVLYKRGANLKKDWQVEIELKSDYLHHVLLKIFTNKLEEHFTNSLQREEQSKYARGLALLDISDTEV